MSRKYTSFKDIPKFMHNGDYRVSQSWKYLENFLAENPEADLDPDFQRGHVWTPKKQVEYVEFILRGGKSSKDIYFNHPGWMTGYQGQMVLVDGKQRMEAVRAFMRNEIKAFSSFYSEFTDNLGFNTEFIVNINSLQTKEEVLQWYLDLNSGGVVHTDDELDKVRKMLKKEQRIRLYC